MLEHAAHNDTATLPSRYVHPPAVIPFPSTGAREATVLVLGPDASHMGGMATVVQQILSLDFNGKYKTQLYPATFATSDRQLTWMRVLRHINHARALRATIRRTGAKIVHIHTCSGFSFYRSALDMRVAQRSGCNVILHIHGAAFDEFHENEPKWRKRWVSRVLTRADCVIGLSASWEAKLRAVAPNANIAVLENAVEIPAKPSRGSGTGVCRFAFLARMDTWKGIADVLDAGEILRDGGVRFGLTLAGPSGSAGDEVTLPAEIRRRGLSDLVEYVGPLQGDAKTNLLATTDVYIQPSHHEGMPIALLEAIAYGLPVVATRVGAVPEVIEDRVQGRVVPSHAPQRLAGAMRELADHAHDRFRMGRAARSLALERFSLLRLRDDLAVLYDAVGRRATPDRRLTRVPRSRLRY